MSALWETEKLIIPRSVARLMLRSAQLQYPNEMCGLLMGWGKVNAQLWWPIPNIHPEPAKYYQMDPVRQTTAWEWAQDHHMDILAIFHSHPNSGVELSSADMKYAAYTDRFYGVVGMNPRGIAAWTVSHEGDVFIAKPFPIEIDASKPGLTWCQTHHKYEDGLRAFRTCHRCGHVYDAPDERPCVFCAERGKELSGTISETPSVT